MPHGAAPDDRCVLWRGVDFLPLDRRHSSQGGRGALLHAHLCHHSTDAEGRRFDPPPPPLSLPQNFCPLHWPLFQAPLISPPTYQTMKFCATSAFTTLTVSALQCCSLVCDGGSWQSIVCRGGGTGHQEGAPAGMVTSGGAIICVIPHSSPPHYVCIRGALKGMPGRSSVVGCVAHVREVGLRRARPGLFMPCPRE